MKIYESTTSNFNNNGLGFLTDVISAKVTDVLNGEYSLSFTYILNGRLSEYLVQDNYVKTKVSDGTEQLFVIKRVVKDLEEIQVYAQHITYELLDNIVMNIYPVNATPNAFLERIFENTNYQTRFTGYSNITNTATARYIRKNPIECIIGNEDNSMVNLFGGEVKRDNFVINFLTSIGTNKNEKLILGKNITGLEINIDSSNIATRIIPIGFDGLTLPEVYIDSQFINSYTRPKIRTYKFDSIKYDPEDSEAYQTLDEAYDALRNATNSLYTAGVDMATVNIDIDWVELSKTKEYESYSYLEKIGLGDTLQCDLLGTNFTTKVIKTKYNVLTDKIDSFEIGSVKATITNTINTLNRTVANFNVESILDSARKNATEQITGALGGYIYKTTDGRELYIMDTPTPETATQVWRWNLNGLGYSSSGIDGPYNLAMTMDGRIVADFITTGTMSAERISGLHDILIGNQQWFSFSENGLEIHQGETTIKLVLNEDSISFKDSNDNIIASWSVENGVQKTTSLQLGNYIFKPRRNGSLDLKHI